MSMQDIDQINASPDVCWIDLMLWNLDDQSTSQPDNESADKCKQAAATCGSCYCGKFATQQQLNRWQAEAPGEWKAIIVEQSS